MQVRDEGLGDPVHQHRRYEREPEMDLKEPDHPELVLEARLVEVQIHPVDALHLERHVVGQDIGHGAR